MLPFLAHLSCTSSKTQKMKKLFYLFCSFACMAGATAQTVGVGTNAPDSNAVLDIVSTNKGVLLPRIVDTGTVPKPLEGLIIYNKATKSPYYYNGTQWRSLGSMPLSLTGSPTHHITYLISAGPGYPFSAAETQAFSMSQGESNPASFGGGGLTAGQVSFSSFNFMKELDINSWIIFKAVIFGAKLPYIEIKLYASETAPLPYASYRFKNVIFESFQMSGSAGGGSLTESVSVMYENYGFKDWVNSVEFGYNLVTKTLSTY
jgi:type VI protein secretion system component Hcp